MHRVCPSSLGLIVVDDENIRRSSALATATLLVVEAAFNMSASRQPPADPDLRGLLTKLTLKEKVSLLAGADWWRTVRIERDDVFVPQLKVRFFVV